MKDVTNVPAIYKDEILHDKILEANLFNDFFSDQKQLVHNQQIILSREQELRRADQEILKQNQDMMQSLINNLCKTTNFLLATKAKEN